MIGHSQESITAISYDDTGMAEAIGSLYEAVAGMDPLTLFIQPDSATITVASADPNKVTPLPTAWKTLLPDNAVTIDAAGDGFSVVSLDGTVSAISGSGTVTKSSASTPIATPKLAPVVPPALAKSVRHDRQVKFVVASPSGSTAVGYWGGLIQTFDGTGNLTAQTQLDTDVTSMAWSAGKLVVGRSDAHLTAFTAA